MKHLFIPYELAVIAKEKGFNERCFAYFNGKKVHFFKSENSGPIDQIKTFENNNTMTTAPLYQQIVDWFREKHYIFIGLNVKDSIREDDGYYFTVIFNKGDKSKSRIIEGETYYNALNKAIEEAFKLI